MAKISMISPATPPAVDGNSITVARWARRLRELGHRVRILDDWDGAACDALVALHARKSAAAVQRFHAAFPQRPLVLALTGTDLYRDLERSAVARASLEVATRLVLLQPLGLRALPPRLRRRALVIYQSAPAMPRRAASRHFFEVVVLAHLRAIKDPLRAAIAARRLPSASRVRIRHAGRIIEPALAVRARREMRRNPRYRWLGELSHARAQRLLASSDLLVLSSGLEGGANVVSEAAVAGVPVLATRIAGSVGLLGARYPGYFEPGDSQELAGLLQRAEADPRFLAALRRGVRRQAWRFEPRRERAAWRGLLRGIGVAD